MPLPGDVLQIEILAVDLAADWGWVGTRPLFGTLPDDFDERHIIHPRIDRARGVCHLPWGKELPLAPFFGVIAVAPPAHWGRCSSIQPRRFGGNMDNKELRPGATLYLPVLTEGALFYAGDGHGVQGDGEVCLTALETALSGTFRLTVRKDLDYAHPFAETATHLIGIGLNEDLDEAARRPCARRSPTSAAAPPRPARGLHAVLACRRPPRHPDRRRRQGLPYDAREEPLMSNGRPVADRGQAARKGATGNPSYQPKRPGSAGSTGRTECRIARMIGCTSYQARGHRIRAGRP